MRMGPLGSNRQGSAKSRRAACPTCRTRCKFMLVHANLCRVKVPLGRRRHHERGSGVPTWSASPASPGAWCWTVPWTRPPRARRWTRPPAERKPIANYLREKRLVTSAQMAAANSIEFGMPLFDAAALDPHPERDQAGQARSCCQQAPRAAAVQARQPAVRGHLRPDQHPCAGRDQVPHQPDGRADPGRRGQDPPHHRAVAGSTATPSAMRSATTKAWRTSTSAAATTTWPGDSGVDAKGDDTPVVKFVNKVLIDAIKQAAPRTSISSPTKPTTACACASTASSSRWPRCRSSCNRASPRA